MSVRFDCPSCKANYLVVDDLAGKMIMCRVCKKRGAVKSLSVAKTSAAAPLSAAAASASASVSSSEEPTRRNFVLIGGTVLASLGAIGVGALLARQPWRRPQPRPTDQFRRGGPRRGEDGKEDGKGAPDEKGGAQDGKGGSV
jgi:hypothetical protein